MLAELRSWLLRRGITQRHLARSLGMSEFRLSRVMNGHFRLCGRERRRIARFFGINQRKLFPYLRARYSRRVKPAMRTE